MEAVYAAGFGILDAVLHHIGLDRPHGAEGPAGVVAVLVSDGGDVAVVCAVIARGKLLRRGADSVGAVAASVSRGVACSAQEKGWSGDQTVVLGQQHVVQ